MASLKDVLGVLREFESLEPGGVSVGLVAWELYGRETEMRPMFDDARKRGLIELSGADRRTGEALWRLTDEGRAFLDHDGT